MQYASRRQACAMRRDDGPQSGNTFLRVVQTPIDWLLLAVAQRWRLESSARGNAAPCYVDICEALDDAQSEEFARECVCAMADKDCIDDMAGQPLRPVLVDDAKTKELDNFV